MISYRALRQVSLDLTRRYASAGRKLKAVPPPKKCIWPRYDLDLWPLTLKTFSAMPTHMVNICVKVEISPLSTDISRHAKYMLTDGRTDDAKHNAPRLLLLAEK